jgi:hypothetical protein
MAQTKRTEHEHLLVCESMPIHCSSVKRVATLINMTDYSLHAPPSVHRSLSTDQRSPAPLWHITRQHMKENISKHIKALGAQSLEGWRQSNHTLSSGCHCGHLAKENAGKKVKVTFCRLSHAHHSLTSRSFEAMLTHLHSLQLLVKAMLSAVQAQSSVKHVCTDNLAKQERS